MLFFLCLLSRILARLDPALIEEQRHDGAAALGHEAFRVELNAPYWARCMRDGHDLAVISPGAGLQSVGQRGWIDGQRMIARDAHGGWGGREEAAAIMGNIRGLAMNDTPGGANGGAAGLCDALMPEANTEEWDAGRALFYEVETDSCVGGATGAGGDDHAARGGAEGVRYSQFVVAFHEDANAARELTNQVDKVVGERIEVVDDQ